MRRLPTLQTPRLILRAFKLEDAKVVAELANDKEIALNTENLPFPYDEHMAADWIDNLDNYYLQNKMLTLAITLRKNNAVIGAIGFDITSKNDHAELGYWLGRPFWGQGFATEACKRLLHHGFTELKYHRIFSCHLKRNEISGRILQKLGMQYEGCQRQHLKKFGCYEDLALYGILREEYNP